MWVLDHKETWAPKNYCFWPVLLEKTLESPLHCKEIQPDHPKGNQSWIFIGRIYAEAETLILWPPDVKSRLTGKDPDGGKDWRQEEKGTTEDEMSDGITDSMDVSLIQLWEMAKDREGRLACCSPWGHNELGDWTTPTNRGHCVVQGPLLTTLWWPTWKKNLNQSEHVWMCNWFTLAVPLKPTQSTSPIRQQKLKYKENNTVLHMWKVFTTRIRFYMMMDIKQANCGDHSAIHIQILNDYVVHLKSDMSIYTWIEKGNLQYQNTNHWLKGIYSLWLNI